MNDTPQEECVFCLTPCCGIRSRRSAGEDLPPPPKTAIAGPEYFGLTHPELLEQIEALDPEGLCTGYWAGKEVHFLQFFSHCKWCTVHL